MIRKNGWLTELQLADIRKELINVSVEENEDNDIYVGQEPVVENDTVSNTRQ